MSDLDQWDMLANNEPIYFPIQNQDVILPYSQFVVETSWHETGAGENLHPN